MAIKFGPDGYSSPRIRRFRAQLPPESGSHRVDGSGALPPKARWQVVAAAMVIVLAALAYLAQFQPSNAGFTAPGTIVAKETIIAQDGSTKQVLGISLRLSNGTTQNIVLEYPGETWEGFQVGDEIVAHCSTNAGGHVTVKGLEPKPGPVEF